MVGDLDSKPAKPGISFQTLERLFILMQAEKDQGLIENFGVKLNMMEVRALCFMLPPPGFLCALIGCFRRHNSQSPLLSTRPLSIFLRWFTCSLLIGLQRRNL